MASKAFFDPIVLLRIAPLVTSGLAMRFSHDKFLFLGCLLEPEPAHRDEANAIAPSYFRTFFAKDIYETAVLYSLTTAAGIANLMGAGTFGPAPDSAWKWYAAGTALAVAHVGFAPMINILRGSGSSTSDAAQGVHVCDLVDPFPWDSLQDPDADAAQLPTVESVKALLRDEPKGQGGEHLREWLRVHMVRSIVADVPAWACFAVGCLETLRPRSR